MPREATGVVEWVPANGAKGEAQGHFRARITLTDGSRPYINFDPCPRSTQAEQRAREKAAEWTKRARRERLTAKDFGLVRRTDRRPLVSQASDDMLTWVRTWLESRTAKGRTSTRDNEAHWRVHIEPAIGGKHIRAWTRDDLRALSRALDEKVRRISSTNPITRKSAMSWKTAQNVWATAIKMCADSAASKLDELRVRDDNPAVGVEGPDRGARKSKQYLYPSEFLCFVSSPDVPLRWRRIATLMVYLYPRPGELRELRWEDVDLEHGTVHIHQATDRITQRAKATKTDRARRFNIEPALLPLLRAMHDEVEGQGRVIALPSDRDLARSFRLWLAKARVKRAELHDSTPTRKAITVYDLRATGITWLAIRGDEPLRIMQRAGHTSFQTTQLYVREAENLRDGFGMVFPTLPPSLLGEGACGFGTALSQKSHPRGRDSSGESSEAAEPPPKSLMLLRRGRDSKARGASNSRRFASTHVSMTLRELT